MKPTSIENGGGHSFYYANNIVKKEPEKNNVSMQQAGFIPSTFNLVQKNESFTCSQKSLTQQPQQRYTVNTSLKPFISDRMFLEKSLVSSNSIQSLH